MGHILELDDQSLDKMGADPIVHAADSDMPRPQDALVPHKGGPMEGESSASASAAAGPGPDPGSPSTDGPAGVANARETRTTENGTAESNSISRSSATSQDDADGQDMSKAMIVYFSRAEGRCHPHTFAYNTNSEDMVGRGAYGDVFKVECTMCHQDFAKKVIRFAPSIRRRAREKHIRDTDMELRCYMTLDHPHVIEYVHHELSDAKMEIYTEFCQLRDLETFLDEKDNDALLGDLLAWSFLEALGSALARCHYGLEATREDSGILFEYTGFTPEWETILHRDVKPGNVLLAFRNEPLELVPKLGDFGTSFKLEDGAMLPATQAGTKVYWAPEIAEESRREEGRITKWSPKGDIWGAGAIAHRILTLKIPSQEQDPVLEKRIEKLQTLVPEGREPISELLARIVAECLDPNPDSRPSALSLLAIALKSETDPRGLRRSGSFWKTLSRHPDPKVIQSVLTHFVTKHLPLLARLKTAFSPREVALIMSLTKLYCPHYLSMCHSQLCTAFTGNMAGSTVFHALAGVAPDDIDILELTLQVSKWPQAKELSQVAVRKNSLGLFPSAVAALRGNIDLCIRLTQLEDEARASAAKIATNVSQTALQRRLETAAQNEFEFMFKMLTAGNTQQFSIPHGHMAVAIIETAQLGYTNVVRKLVDVGIKPSVRGRHQETALHVFAHSGDLTMVRFLLERGAEVDARDRDSCTPLHWAAWAGKLETARELLVKGADVNAVDKQNRSVLFGAAGGGYTEVVRLLLNRRADPSIRGGKSGQTPLERAIKKNKTEIIQLLDR